MNTLYVLNQDFTTEGVIDSYVSCIWRPAYSDVGDFELYMGASKEALELLKENRYIVRDVDIEVDKNRNTTYKKVMIIKNISLVTNVENGDFLTITGKELKFILHQRIVWSQTNLSGTVESGLRQLVNQNAINPSDSKRIIPNLVLGAEAGITDALRKQITGEQLDIAITEICTTYNIGWDIFVYNNQMVFVVYSGVNRSYNQSENPYVVFSSEFENLTDTEYQLNTEEFATTTLIGGEGEGTSRTYTTVNTDLEGLERFEVFTDARDLSSNKDGGDVIPQAQYIQMLKERGADNIASLKYTEGFSGNVISDLAFIYERDFFLGDIVTVINDYGIQKNVRVMSAIESDDENGTQLLPQFNI